MLSDSDAIKLMTAITEVNGGDFTEPGAKLFAASLDDMSLDEALNAFAEWNRQPHDFGKVRPYDLNRVVRAKRSRLIPTEAEISALYEASGMTSAQYFVWRRRLIHGITRRNETRTEALAAATHAALEIARTEKHARVITSSKSLPDLARAFKEIPNAK